MCLVERSSKQAGVPEPLRLRRRRPRSSSSPSRCGKESGGSTRRGWMCFGGSFGAVCVRAGGWFAPSPSPASSKHPAVPSLPADFAKGFCSSFSRVQSDFPRFHLPSLVSDLVVPWDQLSLTYKVIMPGNLCLGGRSCSSRLELCNCCTKKRPWARGHSRSHVPGSSMPAPTSGEAHIISPGLRVLWVFFHPQTRSASLLCAGCAETHPCSAGRDAYSRQASLYWDNWAAAAELHHLLLLKPFCAEIHPDFPNLRDNNLRNF